MSIVLRNPEHKLSGYVLLSIYIYKAFTYITDVLSKRIVGQWDFNRFRAHRLEFSCGVVERHRSAWFNNIAA